MGSFIFHKKNWREKERCSLDGERNGRHSLEKEGLRQHFPVICSLNIPQTKHYVMLPQENNSTCFKTFSENYTHKYLLHCIFLLSHFLTIFLVALAELFKMPLIKLWKFSYSNLKAVTRIWVFSSQICLSLDLQVLF